MTDTPISREQAIAAAKSISVAKRNERFKDAFVAVLVDKLNALPPLNSLREPLDRETLDAIRNLCYKTMENVGTDAALARAVFCQDKLLPLLATSPPIQGEPCPTKECHYCNPNPNSNEFQGTRARWVALGYEFCPRCGQPLSSPQGES